MKLRLSGSLLAGLVAALMGAGGLGAQTNGFVLQCLSARTSGQGCVTRAQGDAPTSLFRDPAGLVALSGPALELNAAPFMPALTFSNGANTGVVDGRSHAYPMASFAYAGRKLGRLAWAVGLEPIGGFGSDFELRHQLLSGAQGVPISYKSFFAAAKFGPALAYELAPGLSVGGSVSGVFALISDFRMPFAMSPAAAQGMTGIPQLDPAVYGPLFQQFTEMTAYGDSKGYAGLTWTADLGVAYRAPSGFAVSASWAPERAIVVDGGSAVIDMSAQFGAMMQAMVQARMQAYGEPSAFAQAAVQQQLAAAGLNLQAGMAGNYAAATTITLPMTAGAGVALPVGPRLRLAGELEWRRWSKAEDVMPFALTEGDNPNINLMLNGDPANGAFTYPFPLYWEDALSAKAGATWQLAGANALRTGFMYGQNPVPGHTVFITFPAISTKALTVGTTWNIGRLPLDVSFVHAFEQELAGAPADHMISSEYVGSRTTMSENVVTVGTVLHFR